MALIVSSSGCGALAEHLRRNTRYSARHFGISPKKISRLA